MQITANVGRTYTYKELSANSIFPPSFDQGLLKNKTQPFLSFKIMLSRCIPIDDINYMRFLVPKTKLPIRRFAARVVKYDEPLHISILLQSHSDIFSIMYKLIKRLISGISQLILSCHVVGAPDFKYFCFKLNF